MIVVLRWRLSGARGMALAVSFLILLFAVAPAPAQETENELWPEINTFVGLSGNTILRPPGSTSMRSGRLYSFISAEFFKIELDMGFHCSSQIYMRENPRKSVPDSTGLSQESWG